ncbi:helix-turn-helix domain-containing protein [Kibdelosporangium phytohabitans]|uniref:DNA-binding protein n=1 Tax=Kibdelosporangium phytohabitans TaxID=860235 RepID=A0A0N9I387_9PSEU|nr:helix-turn-helix domain-containing protein [Kibdelosporangium phytohabitans]ALG10114.1 DNA-binding protein [Kibdelosporangium phytohabitans]MBE1461099.1 transcriptional regulator with XRE-family HTH domain [Kibdelosporangium phytohabitans]
MTELGAFLRARRESIAPTDAGLPDSPRRRTPGLRRAELATLAGVSVEYLTRLEQGRDRNPSGEILGALADALHLTVDERVYLHRLMKASTGSACQGGTVAPARTVRPTVTALLTRLEPTPAVVTNHVGDVLAHTRAYQRLLGPVPENMVWFVFTSPHAHDTFPHWAAMADHWAAELRAAASLGDAYAAFLAQELQVAGGTEFSSRYASSAKLASRTGTEHWHHPQAGQMRLTYETLALPDVDEQRLTVYLPADDTTSAALDLLTLHNDVLQ